MKLKNISTLNPHTHKKIQRRFRKLSPELSFLPHPLHQLVFFSCKPLHVPLLTVQQKGLHPQPPPCRGSDVFTTRLNSLAIPGSRPPLLEMKCPAHSKRPSSPDPKRGLHKD